MTDLEEPIENDEAVLFRRRLQDFERLGFGEVDAHLLAMSDALPLVASRLLDQGATHDQAVRILA